MASGNPPVTGPAERPTLLEVLSEHQFVWDIFGARCVSRGCDWTGYRAQHPTHQLEVWDEACTIKTVEELDALPDRSAVHEPDRDIVWMKDGRYTSEPWWGTGSDIESASTDIHLPARLVHRPATAKPRGLR